MPSVVMAGDDRIALGSEAAADMTPLGATRVRLRTLVLIRWVAIIGQLISILTVHYTLAFPLPLWPTVAAVVVSAGVNLAATFLRPAATRLRDREAALYLGYDVIQLAVLIALTGGLQNPFAILFLVPVTISATILSLLSTAALCGLVLICVTIVAFFHWPLPWGDELLSLPPLYLLAIWVAIALGTVFIAAYAWRVANEARRMANALSATQMALAREQRLSSLGAMAAAAAHELGTPLGTIAVVSRELERDLPPDSAFAEDARLLGGQVARCREILGRLTALGEGEADTPYSRLPISVLVGAAAAPHQHEGVRFEVAAHPAEGSVAPEPTAPRRAEIVHGLGNIIENAIQFCRNGVEAVVTWDEQSVTVDVLDDGPGFSTTILAELGEPYVSTRRGDGRMGLGVFIAKTLLERTGASISFANRRRGGARVSVSWRRADLETVGDDIATSAERQGERPVHGER